MFYNEVYTEYFTVSVKEALEKANISIPFPITTLDTNHPLLVKIENSSDIKN